MSVDPRFRAASEAAESWLNTVSVIADFGRRGNVDLAYQLLLPNPENLGRNLQNDYYEHGPILDQLRDKFATLSDSLVKWEHGRGRSAIARVPTAVYPHVWSSAHEAAADIARLALELLVWPLEGITDPAEQWALGKELLASRWKAFVIPLDEVAALQERIRRERAKLLGLAPPSEAESGGEPAGPSFQPVATSPPKPSAPPKTSEGPFGIVLDMQEWQARREGAVADFAGKELPWKIFQTLCRNYPATLSIDRLLEIVWGKGLGSSDALFVHISAIRETIKPLGLTVENIRKVGYKLTESIPPN